jgi:hypothetical protein
VNDELLEAFRLVIQKFTDRRRACDHASILTSGECESIAGILDRVATCDDEMPDDLIFELFDTGVNAFDLRRRTVSEGAYCLRRLYRAQLTGNVYA